MPRWSRVVAGAVLAALVVAAPVSAATPVGAVEPPGVIDPTEPPGSTTTTSTTTTTLPEKKPGATKRSRGDAPTAVPADSTPGAGPPGLAEAGILLPDDSLEAATQELALERVKVDLIGRRRTALDAAIVEHSSRLTKIRKQRKREEALRLDRAVATYRGSSSGWQLGVIVERGLAQERAVYLVAAADAAARGKIKTLQRTEKRLVATLEDERAERSEVVKALDDAVVRVNLLLDKLAASSGTITLIDGEQVYVPTGPSPVALLADAADRELSRLLLTNQPLATDAKWLAARGALANELARGKAVGNARASAIEKDWETTPPNVVHATLFALRQVGKAYIYATDGPETFDCSGLTKSAYAQIGMGLPHFSGSQLDLGIPVTPELLRSGDLIAYGPDGADHIAMYIGGGLVVEARGRAYGVVVSPVRVDPLKGFTGATRIVP